MHTALDIVRAAIPEATEATAQEILWERTAFPCGAVSARELYQAASRVRRAAARGRFLCDWCDRECMTPRLCGKCSEALRRAVLAREEP